VIGGRLPGLARRQFYFCNCSFAYFF